VKARIHDYAGHLRIEVTPESTDECMLVRAYLREHENCYLTFDQCVSVDHCITFGKPALAPKGDGADK
jgi:hypothetical protein